MRADCASDVWRFGMVALMLVAGADSSAGADPKEMSKDVLAVQIRKQGYKCDRPKAAKRETSTGNPDDHVWVLECGNASYRIHLRPDMAARVEQLK